MEKYYTPDLEEFHVGFRYEIPAWGVKEYIDEVTGAITYSSSFVKFELRKEMLWEWQTRCREELIELQKTSEGCVGNMGADYRHMWEVITTGIKDGTVRVKYLDREDIEELGWKYDGEIFNGNMLEFYHPNEGNDDYSRKLQFPKDIDRLISEGVAIGSGYFDFCGDNYKIKNYNELKTLMKQIGII